MFKRKFLFYLLVIFSFSLFYNSCRQADNPVDTSISSRGYLVSSIELKEFSTQELTTLAKIYNFTFPITTSIKAYKIIYMTIDNDGNEIQASGLVLIPQKGSPFNLITAQHGTQFLKSEAVSNLTAPYIEALAPAIFGYVIFMPDYLGFGVSTNMFHPYHYAKLTASAAIDMIRAGKKFLQSNNTLLTNKLFLMGYSEGGYATMAILKEVQENYSSEFKVTAAAPGAGAFNLSGTAKYLINSSNFDYPGYIPYVFLSYIKYYNLNIKLSDIFQEPYATRIPSLLDGTKNSGEITSNLTTDPTKLLTAQFILDYDGSGYQQLKSVISKNDNYNWKPLVPIRLFQGLLDRQVPYFNSQDALNAMKALGANVEFMPCTIGSQDHEESAIYWFLDTMVWFAKFL
jgi:predicted esterase